MAIFNTAEFNEGQFNAEALTWVQALADSMSVSDAAILKEIFQALAESITMTDDRTVHVSTTRFDLLFSTDVITKQITEKILTDGIRLAAWLSKRRKNSADWSD